MDNNNTYSEGGDRIAPSYLSCAGTERTPLFLPTVWDSAHTPSTCSFALLINFSPSSTEPKWRRPSQRPVDSNIFCFQCPLPSFMQSWIFPEGLLSAGDTVCRGRSGDRHKPALSTCLAAFAHFSSHLGSAPVPEVCLVHTPDCSCAQCPGSQVPGGAWGGTPGALLLTGPHILRCGSGLSLRCRAGEGGTEMF